MWKTAVKAEDAYLAMKWLMKTFSIFCMLIVSSEASIAQRPQYKITAVLDTSRHTVTGTLDITYTNTSAKSLDSLGIHLWPNAYSEKNTALVDQMLEAGNFSLYKARENEMGGLSGLHFTATDRQVDLKVEKTHIDIGWLQLADPLLPGDSIHLTSAYRLQVPVSFSRMGRTGDSYQLTQWYPHLAVFDQEGWHTMPYLDHGEYFNDFADYEVSIQTPLGYTVAATGTIKESSKQDTHTEWVFSAMNVIDFAWFASPTFRHELYSVDVGGDRNVELHLYVDSLGNDYWEKAADYAKRALQFYSDWLGPYPYDQMSVVYTPLSKAGYMEYPMVAQISYTADTALLDICIAHEIGHTWLYAILANDERTHPWLDEGLNSFIEQRYTEQFHPTYIDQFLPSSLSSHGSMSQSDAAQHIVRFNGNLQPPESKPELQPSAQYLFSAYLLPAEGLKMMMSMKKEEMMKNMFRQYYTDHKFSHVTPENLRQSFEKACQCDLAWFFEGWLYHAHEVDYRIKEFSKADKELTIRNRSNLLIPLKINTYQKGKPVMEHWIDGFIGEKIIHLKARADEVHLYDGVMAINKNWRGNIKPRSLIPHVSLLPKIGRYNTASLDISPVVGYNLTDGLMAGLAFTSGLIPQQHFKFVVAPMYGTESKTIRGHAEVRYIGDLEQGPFDKFLLSFSIDDFGYNLDTHYLFRDHFVRWSPTVAVRLQPNKPYTHLTQWLKYRYVHIDQYYGRGIDYEEKIYANEKRNYGVHELLYQLSSDEALKPFTATANLQAGQGFLRLNLNYKQHFVGKDKGRGIWVQGYAGWLPVYDQPMANVVFSINGLSSYGYFSKDYMYDEWLGGRNAESGLFSHQVFVKDAGLKTLSTIGLGDQWMVGGGVSAALPFKVIHFYMDAALYPGSIPEKTVLSYSGGVAIVAWKDVLELYIPFLESKDIRESLSYVVRDRWFERVSFQANIKLGKPLNCIDHLQLGY